MKKTFTIACMAMALAFSMALMTGCAQETVTEPEEVSETVLAVYDTHDTSEGVAATVNGVEIGEKAISAYIDSRREALGLTDDETWSQYLASNELTPEQLRENVIDQYVTNEIILQAAADNGIEVTEEEAEKAYKELYDTAGNESTWRIYLKQTGRTEYDAYESQRLNLYKKKLYNLSTGRSDLENMIDQITSQMLASAAEPEELQDLQAQLAALPSDASQEERADLNAKIEAAQAQALENMKNVQDLVTMIDKGIAKMKESMGIEVYDATDAEVLAYIRQSGELGDVTSLDELPATVVAYVRSQLTSKNNDDVSNEFISRYVESADITVNDAPAGLTYFIEVTPIEYTDANVAVQN